MGELRILISTVERGALHALGSVADLGLWRRYKKTDKVRNGRAGFSIGDRDLYSEAGIARHIPLENNM